MPAASSPSPAGTPAGERLPESRDPATGEVWKRYEVADADAVKAAVARARAAQPAWAALPARVRAGAIEAFVQKLLARRAEAANILARENGKPAGEALGVDVGVTLALAEHFAKVTPRFLKPRWQRSAALMAWRKRVALVKEPYGVMGVISPWNYPMFLAFGPLVGALAAGNRVFIKPSEFTPATSALIAKVVADTFSPDLVTVVTGGSDVGIAFSKLAFDHLVFTGSTSVGRIVMKAAAENLVPVTLELGGKSPAIIGEGYSLKEAAEKIMFGRLFNAGQTCVAPDYAVVPRAKRDAFVEECKQAVKKLYPTLVDNADYTTIVNDRQHARLKDLVAEAKAKGATVVEMNPANEKLEGTRKMAPTLVLDGTDDMKVMQDEIFGPVLPVVAVDSLDEAIDYVNDRARPLALYYFDHDGDRIDKVLQNTTSGGVTINDTGLHVIVDDLPFGGVGASGMGHYHAKEGFDTFCKKKSIFRQSRVSGTSMLRPPFKGAIDTFFRVMLGK